MAITGDGVSHYAASAATITAISGAYSYAFWLKAATAAADAPGKYPFALIDGTGAYDLDFAWSHPTVFKCAFHRGANTTYYTVSHPGTPATGEWHHWCIVYDGVVTLRMYYDGILVASSVVTAPPSTPNPKVFVLSADGSTGFFDGSIADVCVWNVALTAAEVMSIADGSTAPNAVHGANVVQYTPLNADADTVTGVALTNHSAVYNGTYFVGDGGGIALGADMAPQAIYHYVPNGGIALGADMQPQAIYHWVPDGGIALGSGNIITASYFYTPNGGIAVGADMRAASHFFETPNGGIALGAKPLVQQITTVTAVVVADGIAPAETTR